MASHVQSGGAVADATSVTRAFGSNVTTGSLIAITGHQLAVGGATGNFAAGDCTKSAGTATIGTISLDSVSSYEEGGTWKRVAVWSATVTSGGSLTMQVSRAATSARTWITTIESSGSWDASRLEDSAGDFTTTNNTSASSGDAASVGAALFVGGVTVNDLGSGVTITPDAAFTAVYEDERTPAEAASMYRIVGGATTDAATWTLSNNAGWCATLSVYKEVAAGGVVIPVLRRQYQLIKAR